MTSLSISDIGRNISRNLIDKYFRTNVYPYTKHHIDSYDQFLREDLVSIIKANNPILIVKDKIKDANAYTYKIELYVGGEDGTQIEVGTPTLSLQNTKDVRLLFPNEARLRNLTYASTIYADIFVKVTYTTSVIQGIPQSVMLEIPNDDFKKIPLFKIPLMLHSSYCLLHDKPKEFLKEAGECPYDNGGYFIVDGSEKVLITRQEQAFNTLYITPQPKNKKIKVYASISCLSASSRVIKLVSFMQRRSNDGIMVSLPYVRHPVPLFIIFRALGFQTDEEIVKLIFPDLESPEAKFLLPKLQPSIVDSYPILNTYTAVNYIKLLTKGFTEETVINILRNQMFVHMPSDGTSQALFLADCVRKILRVSEGFDTPPSRDDTRNQRCLTSGFLIQELFNNIYKEWRSAVSLAIDREYYNGKTIYKDENFKNIFTYANIANIYKVGFITEGIMRAFKGKWGSSLGEDKTGVLQQLSRLSYCDFMSHCRRVILDFDTGMKLTGPRHLHTSQYGYFCTSETPTGASIGITKNLSILTTISTTSQLHSFATWLRTKGRVYTAEDVTTEQRITWIPVYVNGGLFGFSARPDLLTNVLKLMKRTGCLPFSASISFSITSRKVFIYLDSGRPLRPLIWLSSKGDSSQKKALYMKGVEKYAKTTWRDMVMGSLKERENATLSSTDFFDIFESNPRAQLEEYVDGLTPHVGIIEYVDPYEQNETYIANTVDYVKDETTHIEVHPSTILSLMSTLIPFPHHNQSPRNQLSCSQSKQGVSIYATNWSNRFDNNAHVLCYGEAPLTRTLYSSYLGEGRMPYGQNIVLALACWTGYNQEDGIVVNADAIERGLFRTMAYRSYSTYEENDDMNKTRTRFGNPKNIEFWKDLKPGLDYTKLDDNGIIREGEYVDDETVIVGAFMIGQSGGAAKDVSVTPQVWTRGRVEKVVMTVNNVGLRMVKIRVVQDRKPEIGDKFCLTPDHDVLTERGWVPIADVELSDNVATYNDTTNTVTYENPEETFSFYHTDTIYEFITNNNGILRVTPQHRMYASIGCQDKWCLMTAEELNTYKQINTQPNRPTPIYMKSDNGNAYEITNIIIHEHNTFSKSVHCLKVSTGIFVTRCRDSEISFYTGNSNRHGQKGTINIMLRGHDMPRTASGIVPDMIMNPHAIPSRMTMGQNLEQLLGKSAAINGAVGDATAFMNDGNPQEEIGNILEQYGFEKYGNELLYNGATGEQIKTVIFVGPTYSMRLKHMVEDKWNARGEGRKEQRTHQPTGGRGNEGGLKIGEMDRDTILAHGVSSFFRESYTKRSDGTVIQVCTSCGTYPIYNEKLNIHICPLCDGPVRYAGDNINNLEILPPISRPKSKIVNVEMPYTTKLLAQEIDTFLNIGMRVITTADVNKFRPYEMAGSIPISTKEFPQLLLPEVFIPEKMEETDEGGVTSEIIKQMGHELAQVELYTPQLDMNQTVQDEIQLQNAAGEIQLPGDDNAAGALGFLDGTVQPSATNPVMAGIPSALPGLQPTIIVDTSPQAMRMDGLGQSQQNTRTSMYESAGMNSSFQPVPRRMNRNMYQPSFNQSSPSQPQQQSMQMVPGRVETDENGQQVRLNSSPRVTVQKLGAE
jgi:DNA-directed RNA polymerase II subunit RPB2